MRLLFVGLLLLAGLIQYPLWMGCGGWFDVWDLQMKVSDQRTVNDGLASRNKALAAEIEDLRTGTEAAEERARSELSMLKQGEVFVQLLPPGVKPPEVKAAPPRAGAKPAQAAPPAAATTPSARPANPPR
jgi:cell division protein FtsB